MAAAVLGSILVSSGLPPALPPPGRAEELPPAPAALQREPELPQPLTPEPGPPPLPALPVPPLPEQPVQAPKPGGGAPAAGGPVALLLIDLSEQRLTAFDAGGRRLYRALVSTGLASMPTPAGHFRVAGKYASTPIVGEGYRIPAVAHVMCLGGGGLRPDRICIHPAPWQEAARQAFGVRRSHGCIRVSSSTARWLFQRTPAGAAVRIEP